MCVLEYESVLKEKTKQLQEILGVLSSNLKEEINSFWADFKEGAFRGVKEDNIGLKHSFNLKNLNMYLSSLEFEALKLLNSDFANNFVPVSVFFKDGKVSVLFNGQEYSTSDFPKVKNLFDILSKEQIEKDLSDSQADAVEKHEDGDKMYDYYKIRELLIDTISDSFKIATEVAESLLKQYVMEEGKNILIKTR